MKAGIYFHIPFCKQACHYCDFHFVTSLKYKKDMLRAMEKELHYRWETGFFPEKTSIESIYFGGGTPSLLEPGEVVRLLERCSKWFDTSSLGEVTLEANPDDLTWEKIVGLRDAGVNRLSIGVQSFFDEDLRWMNRAHRAEEAEAAIRLAQENGIENITADLIYGFPLLSDQKWERNIQTMTGLGIPHISAYSMTVEPKTALGTWVRRGQESPMDEDQAARQFEWLMQRLEEKGYEHYEISNWAIPGREAVHNGNYWKGNKYLGIGPSAHSFDGNSRYWNVANNSKYIKSLQDSGLPAAEQEILSTADRFNEYIMTSLRTSWGLDLNWVRRTFEPEYWQPLKAGLRAFEKQGLVREKDPDPTTEQAESSSDQAESTPGAFVLTQAGKLLADRIASDLFYA
ncbi:MAG TPA: radical SAM family heme chaperone HemW [Sphingobacteriaceae bacterium]|nr:radical SAM family heme chaperone HemW [Sphingobacteriaceae bacterium]